MKNNKVPIPGFKGYELDLVTQEITGKFGKVLKTQYDNRGRHIAQLWAEDGKQKKVNFLDLVGNTFNSLTFEPISDVNLSKVLVAYYNIITPTTRGMALLDVSKLVHEQLPELEVMTIGRMLNKIH